MQCVSSGLVFHARAGAWSRSRRRQSLNSGLIDPSSSCLTASEGSTFHGCKISLAVSVQQSGSRAVRWSVPIRASSEAAEVVTIAMAAMAAAVLPLCWFHAHKNSQRANALALEQPGPLSLSFSRGNVKDLDSSHHASDSNLHNFHTSDSASLELSNTIGNSIEKMEQLYEMDNEFSNLDNLPSQNAGSAHGDPPLSSPPESDHGVQPTIAFLVEEKSHESNSMNDDLLVGIDPHLYHSNPLEDVLHDQKKVIPIEMLEPHSSSILHTPSLSGSLNLIEHSLASHSSDRISLSKENDHTVGSKEPSLAENSTLSASIHGRVNGTRSYSLDSNLIVHEDSKNFNSTSNEQGGSSRVAAALNVEKLNEVKISVVPKAISNSSNSEYNSKQKGKKSVYGFGSLSVDPDENPEVYLSLYNRLIRVHKVEESLVLLENMNNEGILDSDKIYHGRFFEECIKLKNPNLASRFLKLLRNPTLSSFNQLIKVCIASNDHESALEAFENAKRSNLKPDTILYTSLISCLCKCGKLDDAFKQFHSMERSGVEPNLKTFGTLIDGCARSKQVAKAFGVYGMLISKKLKPDQVIFNSLIAACSSSGSIDRAFDVLKDMQGAKLDANHVTMGTIIDACVKNKQYEKALNLFYAIKEMKIQPNIQIYTASVNACAYLGDFAQASFIYECLKTDRVKPDEIFFSALIQVSSKTKMIENAFGYVRDMKNFGIQPTSITVNSLMSLCLEIGLPDRAMELYEMTKENKIKITSTTFHILLKTLCNTKQIDTAISLLDDFQAGGYSEHNVIDSKTYHLLISSCIQVESMEKALKLYQRSQMEGIRTNLFTCECLIELCYDQIKKGTNPPLFFTPSNSFHLDSSIVQPHQQWAACAFTVYRNAISGGVIPTRKLVSKILGCFHIPQHMAKRKILEGGFCVFGGIEKDKEVLFSDAPVATKPEEIYEHKALAIYKEAASMGVVPQVFPLPSKVINLKNSYVHTAEVCILSMFKAIQQSLSIDPEQKIYSITLKFGTEPESSFLDSKNQTKSVKLSNKTSQACAALLRRLHVPFRGNPSSGTIVISSSAISKYIRLSDNKKPSSPLSSPLSLPYLPYPQIPKPTSPSSSPAPSPFSHRAKTLVQQQREIRMNSTYQSEPLFPPSPFSDSHSYQQQPQSKFKNLKPNPEKNDQRTVQGVNDHHESVQSDGTGKKGVRSRKFGLPAHRASSTALDHDLYDDEDDDLWLGLD